ncbi:hypothetical protein BDR05DRAFT_956724 [Suillus weaverae]|nr:hypothetical protein BDR05DRAFT_956724 [Suillus weaverae]
MSFRLRSRSTPTALPSTTSSQLGQTPDQYSTKPTREMLEIRAHITELLASYQSEITVRDSGTWDGAVDTQVIVDEPRTIAPSALDELNAISLSWNLPDLSLFPEPLALYGQLSDGPLASVGITGSLSEGVNPPLGQHIRSGILPCSSSGSTGYEPGAQDFPPQHGPYSEEQTLSSSSDRHDEHPLPCIMQDKVQCTRPGCSSVVNKHNLTRHINEVHERKVKARCASCGKGFASPYMMEDHIRRGKCESS